MTNDINLDQIFQPPKKSWSWTQFTLFTLLTITATVLLGISLLSTV